MNEQFHHRADLVGRMILVDWLLEQGRSMLAMFPLTKSKRILIAAAGGYGCGDGDGGHGDGDGGYGYGDGGGVGGGNNGNGSSDNHERGEQMREGNIGFRLLVVQGTSYPYVLAAWVRREGDEVLTSSAVIVRLFGKGQFLASLAKKGPAADTQLGPAAEEDLWRPHVHRCIVADPEKWGASCPKPDSFKEE